MPFATTFETHPIVERIQRLRQNPIAAYGSALGLVALAALVRWSVGEYVGEPIPFITFYPAIIIATLVGGFRPGIVATILSSLAAWYLFLAPAYTWTLEERELLQLSLFILISGINVAVVALLNALVGRIMVQEENMRVLLESAPSGIVVVDHRGAIKLVNEATEKLFGYTREELVGQSVDVLVPPPHLDAHRAARKNYFLKPEKRTFRDLTARRKDSTEFPVDIGLDPVSRGGEIGVLTTVIDITERKRGQDNQKLIIRELQHRTQNLFAVFQAIAVNSVDAGKTAAEIKYQLKGRIQSLASAYAMLADAAWEGASLDGILDREFAGFSGRLTISGCEIVLTPSAAQQFALIVHELGTNALKYGALSNLDGRISIEGKIDRLNGDGTFSFAWKETGGPPPTEPTRKGFGSVILLDSARQFAQSVVMDYPPQGFSYNLQLELNAVESMTKQKSSALRV